MLACLQVFWTRKERDWWEHLVPRANHCRRRLGRHVCEIKHHSFIPISPCILVVVEFGKNKKKRRSRNSPLFFSHCYGRQSFDKTAVLFSYQIPTYMGKEITRMHESFRPKKHPKPSCCCCYWPFLYGNFSRSSSIE